MSNFMMTNNVAPEVTSPIKNGNHTTFTPKFRKLFRGFGRKVLVKMGSDNILLICTVIAVSSGIWIGVRIKFGRGEENPLTPREVTYLKFPGEIFLRMLKMMILPLITTSIITSLTSLDTKESGKIGLYSVLFYLTTTLLAVICGIILVLAIRPGEKAKVLDTPDNKNKCPGTIPADTIMDLIRNMFPSNIVGAATMQSTTCVKYKHKDPDTNKTTTLSGTDYHKVRGKYLKNNTAENWTDEWNYEEYTDVPYLMTKSGMNILGLVVFSIVFGLVINKMGPRGIPLADFFRSLEEAIRIMVGYVIWFSPIGIFFLIVGQIVGMNDLVAELERLGFYMITVILGLFIHGFLVLPALLFFVGRRNPFKYIYGMLQALLTALGTASSSATMPLTLKCLEEHNDVDPRVTRFMIPLGATINMDGTALYEAVAALYIAQSLGIPMDIGSVILISLTATLASIGAAGIPEAGLVTMVMVLIAVGLPAEMYTLIVPVDWFLDRLRTTINVWGDSVGAGIVHRLCRKQLEADSTSF